MSQKVKEIQQVIAEKVMGVWEPAHTSSGHKYLNTQTGHRVDSVTTKIGAVVAKPHLTKWAIKMAVEWLMEDHRWKRLYDPVQVPSMMNGAQLAHTDVRDDAGAVGGVSHSMAERWLNDYFASGGLYKDITDFAPPDCDLRSIAAARGIQAWFEKEKITPIASELLVGNVKFSAGTLDLLYLDKTGALCIGDFKSSNAIDPITYSMQIAAYKHFFQEMTGLKVKHCKILHISKSSDKYTVYVVKDTPKAYRAFKKICGVYDWMYEDKKHEKITKDIKKICM